MNRKQQEVIDYLLEENRILKEQFDQTGKKLRLNDHQRRQLAKKGRILGWDQLQRYARIVSPQTIYAWHRKLVALKYTGKRRIKTDRQKRIEIIRELCVKFAEENPGWGYGRIQGAVQNLGFKISMSGVRNILLAHGIRPSPDRLARSNWKEFVRSHLSVMSAADFFTTEVWTMRGLVRFHTLFVMNLATRKVEIAHISCEINGPVMAQVARNLTADGGFLQGQEYFICDRDPLFTKEFRSILSNAGLKVIQSQPACPEQNGYAERFVGSIKRECLDNLIFLGEASLRKAIHEYVEHYLQERNHQGLENLIPFPNADSAKASSGIIAKSERLGGLLNYYYHEPATKNRKEVQEAA